MKNIHRSFIACASIVLALSACSTGNTSASPKPEDTSITTSTTEPVSTTDGSADEENSADQNSDPNENYSVKNLDDTYDPDAVSCEDPGVECDDYGNVLSINGYEVGEDGTIQNAPTEEPEITEPSTTSNNSPVDEFPGCESTYPNFYEGGSIHASMTFLTVNESFTYESRYEANFTIETLDGEVLFTCESGGGRIYNWGMPNSDFPPLRMYGEIDGKSFDVTLSLNDYATDDSTNEGQYNNFGAVMHADGSMTLYEGEITSDSKRELENNA